MHVATSCEVIHIKHGKMRVKWGTMGKNQYQDAAVVGPEGEDELFLAIDDLALKILGKDALWKCFGRYIVISASPADLHSLHWLSNYI